MAIEFRCPQCQKLLRVGDDAAGKQAKCPGCGTPVTVPSATAPPSPPPVPGGVPPIGDGADPFGGMPLPPVGDNPYAAPFSTNIPVSGMRGGAGPAWERDGASLSSLIATVKEAFSSPSDFFSSMRQEGGFGAPLLFFFVMNVASIFVNCLVSIAMQGLLFGAMPQPQGGGGPPFAAMMGGSVISVVMQGVVWTILLPIMLFIGAGVHHVALMIFGGANRPFETTFRVVAYAGATAAIGLIPFCGSSVQGIVDLVFIGIGLCYAHNTDGWRATLAVLAPAVCCIGGAFAVVVALVGGIAAAGAAAGANAPPPAFQPQPMDPNAFQVDDFQVDEFQIEERWRLSPEAVMPRGFDPMKMLQER